MPRNDPAIRPEPSRRGFLRGFGVAAGTLALGGCDALSHAPWFRKHPLPRRASDADACSALFLGPNDLAREYHRSRPLAGLPRQRLDLAG